MLKTREGLQFTVGHPHVVTCVTKHSENDVSLTLRISCQDPDWYRNVDLFSNKFGQQKLTQRSSDLCVQHIYEL